MPPAQDVSCSVAFRLISQAFRTSGTLRYRLLSVRKWSWLSSVLLIVFQRNAGPLSVFLLGISSVALMLFDEIFVSKSVFETKCVLPPPEWDEIIVYRTNAFSTKCASISSPESHFVYEMRARMSFRIRMEFPRDEMPEDENFVDEMPPRSP